jgi:hypothetical protein
MLDQSHKTNSRHGKIGIQRRPLITGESMAIYNGLQFRTRLEARWAAFFDLAGWEWHVNPVAVDDWAPDFRVTFPCGHSECSGTHTLLVAVVPSSNIEDIKSHPCLENAYGVGDAYKALNVAVSAGAIFGTSPRVSQWEFAHGAGSGIFNVEFFVEDAAERWENTASLVL